MRSKNDIIQAVRHRMVDKGFKRQIQLAKAMGWTTAQVSRALNGKVRLRWDMIEQFAAALGCSPEELAGGKKNDDYRSLDDEEIRINKN